MERARNRARASDQVDPLIEGCHLDLGGEPRSGEPTRKPKPASTPTSGIGAFHDAIREKWSQLGDRRQSVDDFEKEIIEEALEASGGIIAKAARLLSVPRTGLISRIDKLAIDPDEFKDRGG